ncbi:hypothetical protein [Flavobacterium suncheonense]|uniref:Uncharacterized protein n=1 Tax=Flavobacterium suncheonense GH29-5 = DSM 17707 TaxID=1121899 RepID=A0A0A2LZ57_9FLAO|nr:hypothetical protein [Flavobacterium suncheonense]KGO84616.1 hypothetical protein Q764_14405 [Flavobacterium suncheonense GH29-5 = DSM 17707]
MESSELLEFFENQNLNISNEIWSIEISYSKINSENKKSEIEKVIELQNEYKSNSLFVYVQKKNSEIHKSIEINGLDGGFYLHKSTENDKSQSVKLNENNLIMSLGFTILSLNLNEIEIDWILRPDIAELFEFYDLENDILLRGEHRIFRIDKNGNIKWEFGGRDIWVNLEGKREINIEGNEIRLFDFESNEYLINFNGELLEDKPRIIKTKKPTLFTNPKRWFYQKVWEHMTKVEKK